MNLNLDTTDFQRVSNINIPDIFYRRMKTGMSDLDEIFGNGILPGSSFTLTARAGCGKTTFLLQLCEALANNNYKVGYASGEENTFQLAFNCERLNVKNVEIANITNIEKLCEATKSFDVLVIDSFQALTSEDDLNSRELERHAVTSLVTAGKINECAIFFIMHLTKAGVLKGGTLIPHTVDVNMEIVPDDDAGDDQARIISFKKNRFGACGDYSAYMTSTGFAFNGKVDVTEKASPKEKRMEANIQKVLSMKEPPYITKKRVMNELDLTSSQAYVLLKEMTDKDLIKKFGRGDDAIYKAVNVNINEQIYA
jgi:predicted ATP-dependent serine protease